MISYSTACPTASSSARGFGPAARLLALACTCLVAACTGESGGTDSTDSASSQSSSSSGTGDGAERTALCETLCGETAPTEICGEAPSDCVMTCTELGSASCIECRLDTLGWQGSMACGFTPCSFTDVAGYDACAANCDSNSTTCDFVLNAAIDPKCTEVCS